MLADRRAMKQIVAQPALQRGEIHPRTAAASRCAARAAATSSRWRSTTPVSASRRCAREARPAVRAGGKPAHQDASGLRPRAGDRQVAGRAAWRLDADALEAGRRHRGDACLLAGCAAERALPDGRSGLNCRSEPALRRLSRIRTKLCAHARLRLGQMRLERGEIRHVGRRAPAGRSRPAPAVFGSNGPGRHSRRICVRF